MVESDIPFVVCNDVKNLFQLMFPSDAIAKDFTCGANKMSYLVTHGLAPYFKEQLVKDVKKLNTGFTIHFDETTTAQVKKQMDVIIRYWSLEQID